jgi:hypothetical protein
VILVPPAALARAEANAYLKGREPALFTPVVVMAQPLHSAHPTSDNSPTASRAPSVLLLAGASAAGLLVFVSLALWFHYGAQVFFEMIRTGFAACF